MLVRLLGSEVVQRSHVLEREEKNNNHKMEAKKPTKSPDQTSHKQSTKTRQEVWTYRLFDDVKALLVDLEGRHLLDDLLQQDVLLVVVTFDRKLQRTAAGNRKSRKTICQFSRAGKLDAFSPFISGHKFTGSRWTLVKMEQNVSEESREVESRKIKTHKHACKMPRKWSHLAIIHHQETQSQENGDLSQDALGEYGFKINNCTF